jgi:hypothetical protein
MGKPFKSRTNQSWCRQEQLVDFKGFCPLGTPACGTLNWIEFGRRFVSAILGTLSLVLAQARNAPRRQSPFRQPVVPADNIS